MLYSFKLRYMSNLDTSPQIQKCELQHNCHIFQFRDI